MTNKIT